VSTRLCSKKAAVAGLIYFFKGKRPISRGFMDIFNRMVCAAHERLDILPVNETNDLTTRLI
jgi:hypothetical protein